MKQPIPLTWVYKNERQIEDSVAGMAHWAGTGPLRAKCADCVSWQTEKKAKRCYKFKQMTGKVGAAVPGSTRACKYFSKGEEWRRHGVKA